MGLIYSRYFLSSKTLNTIKYLNRTNNFLTYRKRCWNLSGPCAKGQGGLVRKSFQISLYMTDDWKLPLLTDDFSLLKVKDDKPYQKVIVYVKFICKIALVSINKCTSLTEQQTVLCRLAHICSLLPSTQTISIAHHTDNLYCLPHRCSLLPTIQKLCCLPYRRSLLPTIQTFSIAYHTDNIAYHTEALCCLPYRRSLWPTIQMLSMAYHTDDIAYHTDALYCLPYR